MRYLAVDLGDRRTGLATGDSETGIATPLEVLQLARGPALLPALVAIVEREAPDELVLGLPLNMDGSEGERARLTRAFGERLEAESGRPVRYQDERLTSFAADHALAERGGTRKQRKRWHDAVAAAEILREFLMTERDEETERRRDGVE